MSHVLADTHVPPAIRRWGARLGLAVIVAIAHRLSAGPGAAAAIRGPPSSTSQLDETDREARALATENAALMRDIEALRNDVGAVEDRARADLGMVYPDEIVLRISTPRGAGTP